MPALLTIRLKKELDGAVVQVCTRPDGSSTWQRLPAGRSAFFPIHDLTHYAVETILNHRLGFYGLLAGGWAFTDFAAPWPRGRIPADADPSELIVGFFDAQRVGNHDWPAAEFNQYAADFYAAMGAPNPPLLNDEQLERIRARLRELLARWEVLPPGDELELRFDPAAVAVL
jgi:hypothetical protein